MPLGLYRRNKVANASARLHHLSKDMLFNDQGIDHQDGLSRPSGYAEGICWIRRLDSFL